MYPPAYVSGVGEPRAIQAEKIADRRRSLPTHIPTPTAHLPPARIPTPPEHRMHDSPVPHSKSDSLRRSSRREKGRTLIRSRSLERGAHPTRHGRARETAEPAACAELALRR